MAESQPGAPEDEMGEAGAQYEDSDSEDEAFLDPYDPKSGGQIVCELDGEDEGGEDMDEDEDDDAEDEGNVEDEEPVVDVSSGRIQGHNDAIYCVAFHPSNPDLIASASGDDTGGLWNRATQQRIAVLDGHTDTVLQVAFNATGTLVATAGMDGVVKVWSSSDGKLVTNLEGPGEDITFVQWHSKGDVLLAGSSDASVWMWNAQSGSCMAVLSGHSESVTCGMFSQDGKTVITGSQDGSARVWNPKDSSCLFSMSDPKGIGTFHAGPITSIDSKGDFILTGSEDATAILTAIATSAGGAPTGKVVATYRNHTLGVESVAISPSMQYMATGGIDGHVFVYDAHQDTPRFQCVHTAAVTKIMWHHSRELLLSCSVDKSVGVWDGRSGAQVARWTGHADTVMDVAISGDGATAVSGSDDACLLLWTFP